MDILQIVAIQKRNRCYIVGFNRKYFDFTKEFEFPPTEKLDVSTQDILDKDVPEKYFLSKKIIHTIMGTGTKGYHCNPTIDLPISKTLVATMAKMHRAAQDNYFTDNENYEKHCDKELKTNIRKLTPDECRKLQGFPEGWKQVVSDCQAYKQFGNAVTVNVSHALADSVYKYIKQNYKKV